MFSDIDLRALAERSGPERAFLSLYLSGPNALNGLNNRIGNVRKLLAEEPVELEYFEENLKLIEQHLEENPLKQGARCIFACWAENWIEAHDLEQDVPDRLWVDSSPYIRPLAQLQDEYEDFVVVAADNTKTRIFYVTGEKIEEETRVRGDVKNHVKVGGWSQKRYQRRRDNELQHYAADVAQALQQLAAKEPFARLFLLGSDEAMREIEEALPVPLREKLAGKEAVDLHEEDGLWDEAYKLYFTEERASEYDLWARIKNEYLQGGRAVVGPETTLKATAVGQSEAVIVSESAKVPGVRCRACENLSANKHETCPVCSSEDVFVVDLVNELAELCATTSARIEFADAIPGLTEVGNVAALLRW